MESYKQQNQHMQQVASKYNRVPDDLAIMPTTQQGSYTIENPVPPYVLTAQQVGSVDGHPALATLTNPAAVLYQYGNENHLLYGAGTSQCTPGCLPNISKPDPRVHAVKPLYTPNQTWITYNPSTSQLLGAQSGYAPHGAYSPGMYV